MIRLSEMALKLRNIDQGQLFSTEQAHLQRSFSEMLDEIQWTNMTIENRMAIFAWTK